jgi:2-phospho-L-lactate/phosphoenolpyruvate guanylyltransferase
VSGELLALVPVKGFARAKSRLAGCLDAASRAALARSMLEHVLGVLAQHAASRNVLVATDCADVAAAARAYGARIAFDRGPAPLGAIVDRALEPCAAHATRALVLMADLPELTVADLDALFEAGERADVVLAPDLRGVCTNALLLPLPAPPTRFGQDQSLALHRDDLARAGLSHRLCERRGLALDIDRPDDLSLWRAGPGAQVGETRRFGLA